jgi:hypothetical protein
MMLCSSRSDYRKPAVCTESRSSVPRRQAAGMEVEIIAEKVNRT